MSDHADQQLNGLPRQRLADPGLARKAGSATGWRRTLQRVSAGHDPGDVDLYRICRVTAYCDRGTTASGVPSGLGQCAAPADIPFGSRIYIPSLGRTFVVTDRTHRRFRRSTVDIFLPSHSECRQFGVGFRKCDITLPDGETAIGT